MPTTTMTSGTTTLITTTLPTTTAWLSIVPTTTSLTCSSSSGASSETAATSILGSLTFTFVAPSLTLEQVVTALRASLTLYLHVPESCILISVSWARQLQQAETSIENSAYAGTWNVTYEVE